MEGFVATKLDEFDRGKISRRRLIETLTLAATTADGGVNVGDAALTGPANAQASFTDQGDNYRIKGSHDGYFAEFGVSPPERGVHGDGAAQLLGGFLVPAQHA